MLHYAISGGVVHDLPKDIHDALVANRQALAAWEAITPLARNEWICWAITVKQSKTRGEHVKRIISELNQGVRRPCCWMGCIHRTDKVMSASQKWIAKRQID
jgi:hypothetical protein